MVRYRLPVHQHKIATTRIDHLEVDTHQSYSSPLSPQDTRGSKSQPHVRTMHMSARGTLVQDKQHLYQRIRDEGKPVIENPATTAKARKCVKGCEVC